MAKTKEFRIFNSNRWEYSTSASFALTIQLSASTFFAILPLLAQQASRSALQLLPNNTNPLTFILSAFISVYSAMPSTATTDIGRGMHIALWRTLGYKLAKGGGKKEDNSIVLTKENYRILHWFMGVSAIYAGAITITIASTTLSGFILPSATLASTFAYITIEELYASFFLPVTCSMLVGSVYNYALQHFQQLGNFYGQKIEAAIYKVSDFSADGKKMAESIAEDAKVQTILEGKIESANEKEQYYTQKVIKTQAYAENEHNMCWATGALFTPIAVSCVLDLVRLGLSLAR